jgi:hypothetical protein
VGGPTAVAAAGGYAPALDAGIALAQRFEAVTGLPTVVGRSVTGDDAAILWATPFADVDAIEAARSRLADDASWLELLDSTRGRFASGRHRCRTTIYRRLG